VALVSRFKQVSSNHITELLFADLKSSTPAHRTLTRLTEQGFLSRIERRLVGGNKGGSGQYVYQLGRRGFYMHHTGRYQPARAVSYHTVEIAECFVALKRLERESQLAVMGFSTEPDCWRVIGGTELKPDMFVELAYRDGRTEQLWIEVDMGTEGQKQLKGKLEAYWRAYNDADVNQVPVFPRVIWVGVDDERAKELRWLIGQGPQDARRLFAVTTRLGLPTLLQG
jgi:hypothetical protein